MIRKVLGAIVGYVVYFFGLYLLWTAFSVALGPDRLFHPGNYDPSHVWILGSFVLGILTAAIGGYIAALIGKSGAVKIMAAIAVLIGAFVFIQLYRENRPVEPRTVDLPTMEAMFKAREPLWMAAINPLVIGASILAGGTLRKNRER